MIRHFEIFLREKYSKERHFTVVRTKTKNRKCAKNIRRIQSMSQMNSNASENKILSGEPGTTINTDSLSIHTFTYTLT